MNSDLESMMQEWVGIEAAFPRVHHFSDQSRFAKNPSTIWEFYDYCRNKNLRAENLQTIRRAREVSKLVNCGMTIDGAINSAWSKYPIVNR